MANPKKKQTKTATPKKRRGSAPKMGRAPAPTQLEVKGAERPRVPILERLDKEMRAADSDQRAAADLKKSKAQSMAETPTALSLQLAKGDIEKIIHTAIEAQVSTQLNAHGPEIIAEFVKRVLYEKVDHQGKPSGYSSDRPFLTWLSEKTIRDSCADAVKDWLEENKPHVAKAVKAALTKNRDALADQAAQTLLSSGRYGLSVTIGIGKRERG